MSVSHNLSRFASLAFVLLVFGFAGCTKYIEFEGDDATPRLVVNGLMTPGMKVW